MHINVRHDTAAVWIVLQIIDHTIDLIHHTLFIFVLHTELVTIRLADRTIFVCPRVPDMAVQVMDVI